MSESYTRLAAHLDSLPAGFPPTQDGVELKILRKLFTPEEAEIAANLSMMPETAASLAKKLGRESDELGTVLEDMAGKGLIFRFRKKGTAHFMAAQFVIGIWEYHVNDLDQELIEYFNEYVPVLMRAAWERTRTKQLRVIPVSEDVHPGTAVMPYDQAKQIIASQSKIAVAPCICRKEHRMIGKGCDNPMEVCLVFGTAADFYIENGLGRRIGREEALDTLETGKQAGLVLQPGNAQKPASMCMCCGCCCQILKNLNQMDEPASMVHSNFQARVDSGMCTGCGVCADRCHMGAIQVEETAVVNPKRCIGCGVCVPGCAFAALSLQARDDVSRYEPPQSPVHTYMAMARERMADA